MTRISTDIKRKITVALAGALAILAMVVGGSALAAGSSPSAVQPAAGKTQGSNGAQPAAGRRPCPHEGTGSGGSQQQQQRAPTTTSPDV